MPGEEAGSRKGSRVRTTLSQGCPCSCKLLFLGNRDRKRERQRLRMKRTLYSGGARNIS